jgi:hypothetical protein
VNVRGRHWAPVAVVGAFVLAVVVPVSASTLAPVSPVTAQAHGPFTLGPSPIPAAGTFRNGRGGCPVATSFTDTFQFLAPGNGTLTITQPSAGDRVSGSIAPDGSFRLRSTGESYDGKITGKTATAIYSYTAGCTETYDADFVLDRPESDLELSLTVPGRAKIARGNGGTFAKLVYRVAVANNGSAPSPQAAVQLRLSRSTFGTVYQWGVKVGVLQRKRIACKARARAKPTVLWTCQTPPLGRGEAAGVAIVVEARQPGNYVAQGAVEGVNLDPVPGNNGAMRRTTVSR